MTRVTPKTVRAEMLDITQQRMRRRTRTGHSKWTDQEFADLCRLWLKWYQEK